VKSRTRAQDKVALLALTRSPAVTELFCEKAL